MKVSVFRCDEIIYARNGSDFTFHIQITNDATLMVIKFKKVGRVFYLDNVVKIRQNLYWISEVHLKICAWQNTDKVIISKYEIIFKFVGCGNLKNFLISDALQCFEIHYHRSKI